jgi:hypothetical protein
VRDDFVRRIFEEVASLWLKQNSIMQKIPNSLYRKRFLIHGLVAYVSLASLCWGQNDVSPAPEPQAKSAAVEQPMPVDAAPQRPEKFDIAFPGGKLVDLLGVIQSVAEGQLNIIWSDQVERIEPTFPRLTLKNVSLEDLYQVLSSMVSLQSFGNVSFTKSGSLWGVYAKESKVLAAPEPPRHRSVNFARVDHLLEHYSIEAITTAIKTGWELGEVDEDTVLKYHPDTGLLIFAGDVYAINTVMSVVGRLDTRIQENETSEQ